MKGREDDRGILWTIERAKSSELPMGPTPASLRRLAERADQIGHWSAPALPQLRGRNIKRLSFDVETRDEQIDELGPGARRKNCYIVGLAIGADDQRWYFPIRHHNDPGNLDEKQVLRWAREELNAFDGELVGAHLLYDLDFAANEGITFPLVKAFHDIQVAEPLLDEWRFSYGMEALSKDYLGVGKEQTLLDFAADCYGFGTNERSIKRNLWRLPSRYVGYYAEGDVDRPLRIFEEQEKKLQAEDLMEVYTIERKLIPLLLAMRRRGVAVNIPRVEQISVEVGKHLKEMDRRLKQLAGKQAEFTSGSSFAQALKDRGIPVPNTPASGTINPKTGRARPIIPSVNKGLLQRYQHDEVCSLVLEGRKLSTLQNTFLQGHILSHHINGRIHCEFNQLKSEEGGTIARFSSSNPNLQNVPARDEEIGPLIRSAFEPEPGEDWERLDECLTGDTKIITIDGIKTMRELVLKPVPVLATPDAVNLNFKKVTRAKMVGLRPVYRVRLLDGSSVKCTADHEWVDYWGNKVKTKDLQIRSKPGHRKFAGHRLAHVHSYGDQYQFWYTRYNRNFRYAAHLVAEYLYGPKPEGHEVDHINGDASDWTRKNVRYLLKSLNRGQGGIRWWNRATEKERKARTKALVDGLKHRRSYVGKGNPNFGNAGHLAGHIWINDGKASRRVPSTQTLPKGWERGRTVGGNHRVVGVDCVGEEMVYAITVEDDHTYVLANGLVSHNSQVEYRLLVNFARGPGAEEARERYRSDPDTDFHVMCGNFIGADATDSFIRKRVKNTNFCKVYGGGIPKLAATFGCTLEEATEFALRYDTALPFVDVTYKAAMKWAHKRGFVETLLRRKQRFPMWEPQGYYGKEKPPALPREAALAKYGPRIQRAWTHAALNRKLQASAADVIKKAMVDADEAGLFAIDALGAPLLTVHDELDCSKPRTPRGEEAIMELKRIMENGFQLKVPLICDRSSGINWGSVN